MGSWFSYGDMKIGQGRENSKDFLTDNKDVMKEVVAKVKSFMGLDESNPEKNGKP
jgi:recombination protein RecA